MLNEEGVDALTSLGLTLVQSKIFLALSKTNYATISKISDLSKVPRQDIYRVVSELQKMSLVEKILTKPVRFQAVTMEEAWKILLERKKNEYDRLKHIQKEFLREFNKETQISVPEDEHQFSIIKGKEALFKVIKESMSKSKKSVDVVTTQKRFLQSVNYLDSLYTQKLCEGVTCRVVTEKSVDEKAFIYSVKDIYNSPHLELRYTLNPPKAIAVLFDQKLALVALNVNEALLKSPIICTTNEAFLTMFQAYFEKTWNTGIPYKKGCSSVAVDQKLTF